MKRLIARMLDSLGFEIRRKRKQSREVSLDPGEIAEVEEILEEFAESRPRSSALSDQKSLRSYLSDDRIAFFEEVVALCDQYDIPLDGRRVADIGSGTGYLLRLAGQRAPGSELHGYDTFSEMLELARELCPQGLFEAASVYSVDEQFDVVFCTEMLEHMVDPEEALKRLSRATEEGGTLILTVPDGRRDRGQAGEMREDGSSYWGHINFWSPESWPIFLNKALPDAKQVAVGPLITEKMYAVIRL